MRTEQQSNTAQLGWPRFSTLVWVFLGFRIPLLLLERPGGYLLEYPPIGTLGSGVQIGLRNWLVLGPMPLQPLVLDWLSGWFTTELSRQLAIGTLSLTFELMTLVLVYALARRHAGEFRARRSTVFWALLWLPAWTWLTGIEASGVALALAALWLIETERFWLAVPASPLALIWMPASVLVLVPAAVVAPSADGSATSRWTKNIGVQLGWRLGAVLLCVLLIVRPQLTDALLLLLPLIALLLPNTRGVLMAVLLSLLFVLHEPFAPRLLSVQSPVVDVLRAGITVTTIGLAVDLARPILTRWLPARPMRYAWRLGALGAGVLLLASIPLALTEYHAQAVDESSFAALIPEFEAAPNRGYVLAGSNALYERVYALAWRHHTVRVVTDRNSAELLGTIDSNAGPVWSIAHPEEDDAATALTRQLMADGYPAGGAWFGNIRLERILIPPGPPVQPIDVDAAFADAVTLTRAGIQSTVRSGAWLPVDLHWRTPPDGTLDSAVFVHLRNDIGETVAQHDARPAWNHDKFTTKHALRLSPDLPAGTYRLVAGRYLPETGERILLVSGEDGIIIGDVSVTSLTNTEPEVGGSRGTEGN